MHLPAVSLRAADAAMVALLLVVLHEGVMRPWEDRRLAAAFEGLVVEGDDDEACKAAHA